MLDVHVLRWVGYKNMVMLPVINDAKPTLYITSDLDWFFLMSE